MSKTAQPYDTLTVREHEVALLVAEGHSNKIIAARLSISPHTAKFHINNFIIKMNAQTRVDAAVKYTVARLMDAQAKPADAVPA